jgi:ssDNA-specific exonuclease RecJ
MDAFKIASFLADIGQFAFGLVAVVLSIWAFKSKRKDILQTEAAKNQLQEVGRIRDKLMEILYGVHYVSQFKRDIEITGSNITKFKDECPEQWEQFNRYKENSIEIFYKLATPDYYLFPNWLSREEIKTQYEQMIKFAPFTTHATGSKNQADIKSYQENILKFVNHIDLAIQKNA